MALIAPSGGSRTSACSRRTCSCRRRSRASCRRRQPRAGVPRTRPVCAVMGHARVRVDRHALSRPDRVTGFEPVDLLEACSRPCASSKRGAERSRTVYTRRPAEGKPGGARGDRRSVRGRRSKWRGIGTIPKSGFELGRVPRPRRGARVRSRRDRDERAGGCISGLVLRGSRSRANAPRSAASARRIAARRDDGLRRRRVRRVLRVRPHRSRA